MWLLAQLGRRAAAQEAQVVQAARGFAAKAAAPSQAPAPTPPAAAGPKLPAPPLQLSGTSASVATLAWQVAVKENMMERVQEELAQLSEAMTTLPELRLLATDPFVPTLVRKKVFQRLLEDSEKVKVSEISKRLLDSLADENALTALPTISSIYDELVLAQKKEVYVTIVTAQPLDKMEQTEIRKQAEKFVEPGFKLVTKTKVDRKLQGGFVLEFEDRLVDVSTAKKASEFNTFVQKLENDLM